MSSRGHLTKDSLWKERFNKDVKCVICNEIYPVNYKWCKIFTEALFWTFKVKIHLNNTKQENNQEFRTLNMWYDQATRLGWKLTSLVKKNLTEQTRIIFVLVTILNSTYMDGTQMALKLSVTLRDKLKNIFNISGKQCNT